MMLSRMGAIAAIGALFMQLASAHHSYADFDRSKEFAITGHIEKIAWANPHVMLMIKTDASQLYTVEWQSLNQLQKAGLRQEHLAVGDAISLSGARNRNPNVNAISLVSQISVPARNWQWQKPRALVGK